MRTIQLNLVEVVKPGLTERVGEVLSQQLCEVNNENDDTFLQFYYAFIVECYFQMIVCIITLFLSFSAFSDEIPYLVRSPKALLMGDAFTAAPSDEFSIYYNPASLGNGKLIEFSALNPTFSTTNILEEIDKFDDLSSDPGVIASTIMGTPLLIQGMGGPVLKFGSSGTWITGKHEN